MARKPTVKNDIIEDPVASSSLDLESAIDDLRGALKADEEGTLLPSDADAFSAEAPSFGGDFGADDLSTSFGEASPFDDASPFGGASAFGDTAAPSMGAGSSHGDSEENYGLEANHELIMDIPIDVQIVLGSSRMPVKGLMNLKEGTTVTLDKKIGEPVDITVNGRLIARGEITLLEDDDTRFGVKVTELSGASKG
ncbi:flagellar motor switch protein FliN [Neorhizobium lilium]|uniref:Flagellar motor switch protein FliN n=1 Tax=Neorhizobium lilium TaxID=2503024 RepID=A0A3S3S534_9HYPH|nr:flagellar motor switch protein FliN [Neorhizobium lilium]RWX76998.1 flagellar motor switch protein FliN [Neorhizobium lilium]